jgi:hypothetical protein
MTSFTLYSMAIVCAISAIIGMAACTYYAWPGPNNDGWWVVGFWIAAIQFLLLGLAFRKGDQ